MDDTACVTRNSPEIITLAEEKLQLLIGLTDILGFLIICNLFPGPTDLDAPCLLCGTPQDEQSPENLVDAVQNR